ncbi:MAG: hypothetical protein Q9195_005672 [Heterodermia aff. obscurata]
MVSELPSTPSPKRRKVDHAKPRYGSEIEEHLNTSSGMISQTARGLHHANLSWKESRPPATAKEETDVESESSSEVDDVRLADFDTEGMTMEELKLWSRCAPKDQKLVLKIDSPVPKYAPKVHFGDKADSKRMGKAAAMDTFIRGHPFFLLQQTSSFTTSQRKAFEMDVFQRARELGFSSANAEKQIIHARRLCGEKEYQGGRSKLNNEISDSEAVSRRDSTIEGVDRGPVSSRSSSDTLRSARSIPDAEQSRKFSNQNTKSHLEVEAPKTVQRKKKRRRSTSSAGHESALSEPQAPTSSKQVVPGNQSSLLPKSDGVNGDPSQLLEVPDDVSWYLDAQAKKKKAKMDKLSSASTLGNDTKDVQHDSPSDHVHSIEISQGHQSTDVNKKPRKDEGSEKQTGKIERRRSEKSRKSRRSSADDEVAEPSKPRKELTTDDQAERKARKKEHRREGRRRKDSRSSNADGVPSAPTQELTIDKRAEKKARKKERRQQARENPSSGASSTVRELQGSVNSTESTRKANNKILDDLDNLLKSRSAKDRLDKKKHTSKERSVSKESGFQSPMIQ